MFYTDLKTNELDDGYLIRAVGWLTNTEPFTVGSVSVEFRDVLHRHIEAAWQPFYFAGCHDCELCESQPFSSSFNLFISTDSILYYSPIMVEHYIIDHDYQPPQEFINAVMASPAQATTEYFQAVRPFAERWNLLKKFWRH